MNQGAPNRVSEVDFPGVQTYTCVGIGPGSAVLEIPFDRASHS